MVDSDDTADAAASASGGRSRLAYIIVLVATVVEALGVSAAMVWYLFDLFTVQPSSTTSAWALLVVIFVGALWTIAAAIGTILRRSWSRSATLVWQVLQVSLALGCFQSDVGLPGIGWALLILAIVVFALVLWPGIRVQYRADAPDVTH